MPPSDASCGFAALIDELSGPPASCPCSGSRTGETPVPPRGSPQPEVASTSATELDTMVAACISGELVPMATP